MGVEAHLASENLERHKKVFSAIRPREREVMDDAHGLKMKGRRGEGACGMSRSAASQTRKCKSGALCSYLSLAVP